MFWLENSLKIIGKLLNKNSTATNIGIANSELDIETISSGNSAVLRFGADQ